ncbi:aminotransferase class I/II-fold pyridoxal phosphate-dependent enzyme [Clostridium sp. 19966]|uniref:aminotransferase class I/II-fold pyridoxal phosphate-dependent enzyme n=1 Tax=Clostridium sp. 19966 TaxID=2768166 RepID=UPI0028DEBA02|nr:aminotransferase class I/II-fold pyridoxal phosphate-dependent enzyme [Clostridium sp. 19966]MDT8718708.1 aminotransferase class I/II-fold pyridoxal phosphate-dependent enzyme [Clostridium sp. 19966]
MRESRITVNELKNSSMDFKSIYNAMMKNGEKIVCEFIEDSKIVKWTYSDYNEKILKTAAKLSQMAAEIQRGSYIGIKMSNSPYWPITFWSILMAGYKPLLLDAAMADEMTSYLMKQAGAKMLINSVIKIGEEKVNFEPKWENEFALCTSGTTSTSKVYYYDGESVSHQILNAEYLYYDTERISPRENDKVLAFLPMHHIFGLVASYLWFSFYGTTVVYIKDRSPETIMKACREHKVTHITTVPLLPNNLAKGISRKLSQETKGKQLLFNSMLNVSLFLQKINAEMGTKFAQSIFKNILNGLLGPQIRVMISGGSHIPYESMRLLNGIGYFTTSGFGMTEVGVSSCETSDSFRKRMMGSTGKPLKYIEYKVVKDSGNESGDVLVRGKAIHSGRLIDGEKVPAEVDKEGWFDTGDIGRLESGRLFIDGRIKDLIINESGENVYPDELEDYYSKLSVYNQLSVLGTKKDANYEYITLVVSLAPKDMNELIYDTIRNEVNRINGTLPVMKRVNKVYITSEPLPVVNGIKVKRAQLKKDIENNGISVIDLDLRSKNFDVKEKAEEKAAPTEIEASRELKEIKEKVRGFFAEVLHLPEESVAYDAHFIDDLGGDSLSSISLLVKVEEKYNVVIPDSEYYNCTNVNNLSALIVRKLYGISEDNDGKVTPDQQKEVTPITSFESSREYKALVDRLKSAEEAGNPYFVCHDSAIRDVSMLDGEREVLNFGSYNYVGMSGHPETIKAAQDAAEKYGTSASGSRILAGEKHIYMELEKKIAEWKHTEDSIVLVGGHSTNVTFVGNFCNERDIILYDALSHNSIVQGCQLSKSDAKAFPHNDFAALESILKNVRPRYEKILVVVEGVYSMDGDIAPMPEFIKLKKKYGFFLMVDEAHSACVIGEHGRGVDEYFNLDPYDIDVKMGTLSKGLGTCGGYLAGKKCLVDFLRYTVPGFVFSVGINPPSAAATMKALEILTRDNSVVKRLHENIDTFVSEAHKRGLNTCLAGETAIIPIMVGDDIDAFKISNVMLERGVFVPPAVYPAVPKGQARLRFCVISEHKEEQIIKALDILMEVSKELNIDLSVKEKIEA